MYTNTLVLYLTHKDKFNDPCVHCYHHHYVPMSNRFQLEVRRLNRRNPIEQPATMGVTIIN